MNTVIPFKRPSEQEQDFLSLKLECDAGADDVNNWRARWPRIAGLLAKLRADYDADRDFSAALGYYEIECEKNNRAAFIKLGQTLTDDHMWSQAFARCSSESPQYFWLAIEKLNMHKREVSLAKETDSDAEEAVKQPDPAPAPAETTTSAGQESENPLGPNSRLRERERGVEVADMFQNANARTVLGRVGPAGWKLILVALDAGWITRNNIALVGPSARLLVPFVGRASCDRLSEYKLDTKKNAEKVTKVLVPFFTECIDELRAAPNDFQSLFDKWKRKSQPYRPEPGVKAGTFSMPNVALDMAQFTAALPVEAFQVDGTRMEVREIKLCGETIFPVIGQRLTYAETLVWCHLIEEHINRYFRDQPNIETIGLHISQDGLHTISRVNPAVGSLWSTVGVGIRARGKAVDRSRWFDMAALPHPTE